MMIEIQCGNFSNFDAALGRYVECGEKTIVSGDQVGQFVTCSKCGQPIEVPYDVASATKTTSPDGSPASPDGSLASQAAKQPRRAPKLAAQSKTKRSREQSSQPANRKSAKRTSGKTTGNSTGNQRPGKGTVGVPKQGASSKQQMGKKTRPPNGRAPANAKRNSPVAPVRKADVMAMDFDQQNEQSKLNADRMERCKKCGNLVDNGQCTVCKYVEPKFEKLFLPLNEIEIELTGFQRWFCRTMNDGVSLKFLEYGAHGMIGLLGLLSLAAAILSMFGFGLGLIGGVLLLILICAVAMLYVGLIYKGHQFLRDPDARLAWFQKPFWNVMLLLARANKWQNYDSRLKGRKIIKVRERLFGDHEVADLKEIKICQVLDLQGTSISDRGLLDLYDLKHLHCVVLKGTKVTHNGVFRLQQSFPRLWIWY